MNIVFLEAVQDHGGARKSTLELAKRLQGQNHNILVIDFWGSCGPFIEEVHKMDIPIKYIDKRENPIILSHSNKFIKLNNYFRYFFSWLKYRSKIKGMLKEFDTNLIIVNNVKTLSLLIKSRDYKIVFFSRGWFLPHTISKINKKIIKKLTDVFIGVSQATRHSIYAGKFACLEDIYVVPNAINCLELHRMMEQKSENFNSWDIEFTDRPFIILHCGGFTKTKGQHISIEIAKSLKRKGINFKMLLIGGVYQVQESQLYYEEICKKIISADLSADIDIIKDNFDVLDYFYRSDILIHPSSTEGLPRVLMEAMCLGKPVIVNPVGGMTDFVLHNYTGFLTNFNNINEYVEYIMKLYEDKELYKNIALNVQELIRSNYCSQQQIIAFERMINGLNISSQ